MGECFNWRAAARFECFDAFGAGFARCVLDASMEPSFLQVAARSEDVLALGGVLFLSFVYSGSSGGLGGDRI